MNKTESITVRLSTEDRERLDYVTARLNKEGNLFEGKIANAFRYILNKYYKELTSKSEDN